MFKNKLITIVKDLPLISDIDDEKILNFNACIDKSLFPRDFESKPEKYNLIIKFLGFDSFIRTGYIANHFSYKITYRNDWDKADTLEYKCYDILNRDVDTYHSTTLTIGMGNSIYELFYDYKIKGETPTDGVYASIYLQRIK